MSATTGTTTGTDTTVGTGTSTTVGGRERADLLETLARHRFFLRFTVRDLTDEQASRRTTASELSLGGLVKHVTASEAFWADFVVRGAAAAEGGEENWPDNFRMLPGETLAGVLAAYDEVARRTDELVRTLPDLDADHALPEAPWFEPGARWSARRALLHVVAETAQHAGHADILRESLDGARTMG
jgi:uncharacterized damage-inducible protein DinB